MNYFNFLPFIVASAAGVQTPAFITSALGWVVGLGGGLVAIFIVASLVKDAIGYAKGGSGSIWAIIGKALFLVVIIGLIFLIVNYQSIGQSASNLGNKALNEIVDEANNILP